MVGWSWYTFHTLKYGVKVRRVSEGSEPARAVLKAGQNRQTQTLFRETLRYHYWTKALPELHHRGRTDKFISNKNLGKNFIMS